MRQNKYPDFTRNIYSQFDKALQAGINEFFVKIPVVSLASNRITVGAQVKQLPRAPHTISLRKHPTEAIRVALESPYGLACPAPLSGIGIKIHELPVDVSTESPALQRYAGIVVLSRPSTIRVMGASYEGDYCHIDGFGESDQNLFVAQIAGAAMREATKVVPLP